MARRSQKGQVSGANAATLVALIALFILLYILFLPPHERQALLEDGEDTDTDGSSSSTTNTTFLLQQPGSLDDVYNENIDHIIPAVNLFATENAKVLASANSIFIKRSLITKKTANFTFEITDLRNVQNVLLTFLAKEHKGTLTVQLNGQEIYYGDIDKENTPPLRLESDRLKNGKNTLSFEVSSVGWKFWKVNKYQLETVQVTADVTDISQQLSQNIFIVSTTENNNIDRSYITFTPECIPGQVGVLDVMINTKTVYSAVPDCGSPARVEFSTEALRNNENKVIFKTNKGNYLIDLIKITSDLKEARQPTYYFNIPQDVYDEAVIEEDYPVVLRIEFVDDVNIKEGVLIVNGRELGIYQRERQYETTINDLLLEGNNAIKIIPKNSLEIIKLEVSAE